MPIDYLPILILVVVATAFAAIALILGAVLGPRKPDKNKEYTYEAGKLPFGGPWEKRISIRYYMIAVLFLLFDVAVIFLYPWAVALRGLKTFGLLSMGVFALIVLVAYLYVRQRGALEWD